MAIHSGACLGGVVYIDALQPERANAAHRLDRDLGHS